MVNKPTWGKQRVADLKQLWREGRSGSEIAKIMKISRSAVLSAARRHDLQARSKGRVLTTEERKVRKQESNRQQYYKAHPPQAMAKDVFNTIPSEGTVSFRDLRWKTCRWIVGPVNGLDTQYCKADKSIGSFCDYHANLVYTDPKLYAQRRVAPRPWLMRRK